LSDDFFFDNSQNGAFATVGADGQVNMTEMNRGITPIFFKESLPDQKATEAAGTLRMRDQINVRLHVAGDMNSAPVHPLTDELKERFRPQYDRWLATQSNDHIDGTPLAAWPQASAGFVAELKALQIRSVEDLAAVSDTNIGKIMDGRLWREKAKAWLATSKDATAAVKYAAENERLKESVEDLKRQVAELAGRVEGQETNKRSHHKAA
jgi:hypothetical protein